MLLQFIHVHCWPASEGLRGPPAAEYEGWRVFSISVLRNHTANGWGFAVKRVWRTVAARGFAVKRVWHTVAAEEPPRKFNDMEDIESSKERTNERTKERTTNKCALCRCRTASKLGPHTSAAQVSFLSPCCMAWKLMVSVATHIRRARALFKSPCTGPSGAPSAYSCALQTSTLLALLQKYNVVLQP